MLTLQAKHPVGIMNHYQLLIVIYKHSLSLLLSVKSRRDTGGTEESGYNDLIVRLVN